MTGNSSSRSSLDPDLASILESIRATVASPATEASSGPQAITPLHDPQTSPAPAREDADARTYLSPPSSEAPARGPTVEEFLADLVRPHVEAWLNENLPEVVQNLAQAEIARLTGQN